MADWRKVAFLVAPQLGIQVVGVLLLSGVDERRIHWKAILDHQRFCETQKFGFIEERKRKSTLDPNWWWQCQWCHFTRGEESYTQRKHNGQMWYEKSCIEKHFECSWTKGCIVNWYLKSTLCFSTGIWRAEDSNYLQEALLLWDSGDHSKYCHSAPGSTCYVAGVHLAECDQKRHRKDCLQWNSSQRYGGKCNSLFLWNWWLTGPIEEGQKTVQAYVIIFGGAVWKVQIHEW